MFFFIIFGAYLAYYGFDGGNFLLGGLGIIGVIMGVMIGNIRKSSW